MKKTITMLLLMFCITLVAQDKIYVHTATAENSSGDVTYIDHPDFNNNPNAGVVYSHVWNPNGNSGVYNNNFTTIFYQNTLNQWAIANENLSDIVIGSSYNVYISSDPSNVITHVSEGANQGTFGPSSTVIDHPSLNGSNPGPAIIFSNSYRPNFVDNNDGYSLYYDVANNKRGLFNRHGNDIPIDTGFNILLTGVGATSITHISDASNTNLNYTIIDHPELNGNPNATFVFSHYWGLYDNFTDLDNVKLGVWYNGINWSIYYEDSSHTMQEGVAFDIVIASQILGNEDFEIQTNISMYPNPAKEATTITTTGEISTIRIFNLLGQEISNIQGTGKTMQLDLTNLSAGNYFIKVQVEDTTETLKLIKK